MPRSTTTPQPDRPTTVRWTASLMATAIYAAEAVSRGLPLLDSPLDRTFLDAARSLRLWIGERSSHAAFVWNHLGGLSADIADPYALAGEVATRMEPAAPTATQIAELGEMLATLKHATRVAFPELVQELAVRVGPLRQQWEARGPGMMRELLRLTHASISPAQVEVLLVAPLLSGGGRALFDYARCFFETVLVHPHPDLPEPVRLAWLIGQLGMDTPEQRDVVPAGRFPLVCQLALVPPVLLAAESVEWTVYRPDLIRQALATWHVPTLPNRPAHEWLIHWWEHVRQDRLPWNQALRELDEWLG